MTVPNSAYSGAPGATPPRSRAALRETIVGQPEVVEGLVLALIAGGHVLLEGAPGVAKTLACRALRGRGRRRVRRVQFTPDLLPSDVVGTRIFDQKTAEFVTVLGPLFANVVLADEINRAPAKVQSALLEGMQERRATIGLRTHDLPAPFVVLATMNPYDADGTYPLPLAQLDRFLVKLDVPYPSRDEERAISTASAAPSRRCARTSPHWPTCALAERGARGVRRREGARLRGRRGARVARRGDGRARREPARRAGPGRAGPGPRVRGGAAVRDPDDVRDLAPAVLRHRISYDDRIAIAGGDPEEVVRRIVASVPAP